MDDLADFVRSTEGATIVGKIFDAPLVVKGKTWLPVTELGMWGIMTCVAGHKRPARSWGERLGVGALTTLVILGSEWLHNLAHAAAACRVGKPAQAIRITFGMPLLIYPIPEDPGVTPLQHIARSLGGPLFNALLLLGAATIRRFTRPDSVAREVADAAMGMNLFLCTASLVPNPEIDGGPALKWALVEGGSTPGRADAMVKKANQVVGLGLAGASGGAFARQRPFLGAILGMLSWLSLDFGFRRAKDKESIG